MKSELGKRSGTLKIVNHGIRGKENETQTPLKYWQIFDPFGIRTDGERFNPSSPLSKKKANQTSSGNQVCPWSGSIFPEIKYQT
ncbi:hypothetical protein CLV31_108111 [Algoriphagus aquaeductus]|uniref:Uncharacterized protein n=1 Tax=Algoriphagus aquaeductus TaxID=475299 RepID=A0A326RZY3_9BACT|nr:hypothetical protein CLV31_108111 [Algoriphagus aquaeductus]